MKIVEPLFEIFDKNLISHSKFPNFPQFVTQYRVLSNSKWLSARTEQYILSQYWVLVQSLYNTMIFQKKVPGSTPECLGSTTPHASLFIDMCSLVCTESYYIAQYNTLNNKVYWVFLLHFQHIVQCDFEFYYASDFKDI